MRSGYANSWLTNARLRDCHVWFQGLFIFPLRDESIFVSPRNRRSSVSAMGAVCMHCCVFNWVIMIISLGAVEDSVRIKVRSFEIRNTVVLCIHPKNYIFFRKKLYV